MLSLQVGFPIREARPAGPEPPSSGSSGGCEGKMVVGKDWAQTGGTPWRHGADPQGEMQACSFKLSLGRGEMRSEIFDLSAFQIRLPEPPWARNGQDHSSGQTLYQDALTHWPTDPGHQIPRGDSSQALAEAEPSPHTCCPPPGPWPPSPAGLQSLGRGTGLPRVICSAI